MKSPPNCTLIASPCLSPKLVKAARPPRPKLLLLLRSLAGPGGVPGGRHLALPLSRAYLTQERLPELRALGVLGTTRPVLHSYTCTLTLPARRRKQVVAELEELLRQPYDHPESPFAGYYDVCVLDEQRRIVHWQTYHGPGCWRIGRFTDPDPVAMAQHGDEVTFTNAHY